MIFSSFFFMWVHWWWSSLTVKVNRNHRWLGRDEVFFFIFFPFYDFSSSDSGKEETTKLYSSHLGSSFLFLLLSYPSLETTFEQVQASNIPWCGLRVDGIRMETKYEANHVSLCTLLLILFFSWSSASSSSSSFFCVKTCNEFINELFTMNLFLSISSSFNAVRANALYTKKKLDIKNATIWSSVREILRVKQRLLRKVIIINT